MKMDTSSPAQESPVKPKRPSTSSRLGVIGLIANGLSYILPQAVVRFLVVNLVIWRIRIGWLASHFFLWPLLSRTFNPNHEYHANDVASKMRWRDIAALKFIWMCKMYFGPTTFDGWMKRVLARMLAQAIEEKWEEQQEQPVPSFAPEDMPPERFIREFLSKGKPVVIKGLMSNETAFKEWTADKLVDKYADTPVYLTNKDQENQMGHLRDVRDKGLYLHNSEQLLMRYPHLQLELSLDKLKPFLPMWNLESGQIFLGFKYTGSSYHCANTYNMFLMVDGKKKWTFVDPQYFPFMYPYVIGNVRFFISLLKYACSVDLNLYPLYKYCPRQAVTLEKGDVLLNPGWWWHNIENTTPTSIGVATRWAIKRNANMIPFENNTWADFMQQMSPETHRLMYKFIHHYLYERAEARDSQEREYPLRMQPFDEHKTIFEVFSHSDPRHIEFNKYDHEATRRHWPKDPQWKEDQEERRVAASRARDVAAESL